MTGAVFRILIVCLGLLAPGLAQAQGGPAPKVAARLVALTGEVTPGGALSVALEEDIAPGWHTYWVNPGAAGAPAALDWTLPPGWSADAIGWPYPKRLVTAGLVDYGYEGRPWLLTTLHAPKTAKPGDAVTLKAHASWLVCKDICIPEEAELTVPVAVSTAPSPPYATTAEAFAAARAKLPSPAPWPVRYQRNGTTLTLFLAAPALAAARPVAGEFFPSTPGQIDGLAEQTLGIAKAGAGLRLTAAPKQSGPLQGVVVLTSKDGSVQALSVQAGEGAVPALETVSSVTGSGGMGFGLAVLFALLGGLILNLMPCVLPVLALKALALANTAHAHRTIARNEGLAYGLGAVLSFVALGTVAAILRAGGEEIGWGFQLQNPIAIAGFALLLFGVGLNLSGLYEIETGAIGGARLAGLAGPAGAFFTGILAVAVAAPCTAPFMAAALSYALAQGALSGLAVFAALGVGFAAPFVLLGVSPALARLLPRPGAWMVRLREALAFPMYGASAWMLWVLTQEAGANALLAALASLILFAFAIWTWRNLGRAAGILALFAALGVLAFAQGAPAKTASSAAVPALAGEAYSPQTLAALRKAGRPVFVDATAAWCITCLVNETVALSAPEVQAAFKDRHIAYLIADWTRGDAQVTELLGRYHRSGVPLYLYYAPGAAEAQVLPQILTPGDVLSAAGAR